MPADEVFGLARDFGRASAAVTSAVFDVFRDEGKKFTEQWRANAKATARKHGKHYPNSITDEMRIGTNIVFEAGPESGRPQGGMGPGFEFGSQNQPPHLDGARAMTGATQAIMDGADKAIEQVIP